MDDRYYNIVDSYYTYDWYRYPGFVARLKSQSMSIECRMLKLSLLNLYNVVRVSNHLADPQRKHAWRLLQDDYCVLQT